MIQYSSSCFCHCFGLFKCLLSVQCLHHCFMILSVCLIERYSFLSLIFWSDCTLLRLSLSLLLFLSLSLSIYLFLSLIHFSFLVLTRNAKKFVLLDLLSTKYSASKETKFARKVFNSTVTEMCYAKSIVVMPLKTF